MINSLYTFKLTSDEGRKSLETVIAQQMYEAWIAITGRIVGRNPYIKKIEFVSSKELPIDDYDALADLNLTLQKRVYV